jgi:hypothetical protein
MLRMLLISILSVLATGFCMAQADPGNNAEDGPKFNSYQIYLKKPAQEIKEIQNYKDCKPIKGNISEGKKTIIMEDYVPGNKVYLQIIYTDGTHEEFVRSPCFIDPVIL